MGNALLSAFTLRPLLDLVWPRTCEGCGAPAGDAARYFCWDCLAALPLIEPPFCSACGDPVQGAITRDFVCSTCVDRPPAFERARSAARFRGPLKEALHRFKYSGATHLSRDLAVLLHACVQAQYGREPFDAVTCVPLHPVKQRARTYNQAHLLAGDLARLMRLPLAHNCLARVRETATQTRLTAKERQQNVRGAFQTPHPGWVQGRRFLLVDDVMTTGATLRECSRMLKDAGAASVFVVTVARG
jgi:ComF family protein